MYLVATPRIGSNVLLTEDVSTTTAYLNAILEKYSSIVGLNMSEHESKIIGPAGENAALFGILKKKNEPERYSANRNFSSVVAGVVRPADILSRLSRRAGDLIYEAPVWGSYSTVVADRHMNCLTAWGTVPGVETNYFAQTAAFTFVSNRPLLVALAIAGGNPSSIQLSRSFLTEYLLYGYSMTSTSPFERVKLIPSNKSLVIHDGEITKRHIPSGLVSELSQQHSADEASEALATAMTNSLDRCRGILDSKRIQLRVSGGKDSRALLGMIRRNPKDVYGVTFGQSNDSEVRMSNLLCQKAGISLTADPAPQLQGNSFRDQVETSLLLSDGIPLSEPHGSIYKGANPSHFGEGIMLGQWPLMKGGAARKMRYTDDQVRSVVLGQGSSIVSFSERLEFEQFFDDWLRIRMASSMLEKLYLFSRDFRSARWMLGLTTIYDRDATVVYPLADSEVAAVSDVLTMGEKIGQSVYFNALEKIWPLAVDTPIVGSKWKFEESGLNERFRPQTYESRNASVEEFFGRLEKDYSMPAVSARTPEFLVETGCQLAKEIVSDPQAELIRSIIEPDFWDLIEAWSTGSSKLYQSSSRRITIQLIWRVYVATIWYSGEWLRDKN